MTFSNRMTRTLDRLSFLPESLRWRVFSLAFGREVPFVATGGLRIERLTESEAVISLANRRRVQNHVGGIHAAAVALLAETASGLLVGRNLPDGALPLMSSLRLDYTTRASGGLRAVASLSAADIAALRNDRKGRVSVPVTLTDAAGKQPVETEMVWAWLTRRESSG